MIIYNEVITSMLVNKLFVIYKLVWKATACEYKKSTKFLNVTTFYFERFINNISGSHNHSDGLVKQVT